VLSLGKNLISTTAALEVGTGRSGNGYSYVDIVSDATYSDWGFRVIRDTYGANSSTTLATRGTGDFIFQTNEAAQIKFVTNATTRGSFSSAGAFAVTGLVSCGGIQTNASGVMSCTSDATLKDIQSSFTSGLDAILNINPQTYSWKTGTELYDGGVLYSGFIAQNIESAIPEAVNLSSQGTKQINTTTILATAVNAIKDLAGDVNSASSSLAELTLTVADNYATASSSFVDIYGVIASNQVTTTSLITGLSATLNASTTNLYNQIQTITSVFSISNAPANSVSITASGVIGIGNDGTQLGDELLRVSGRIRATGFDIDTAADLAEKFEAVEAVDAGTVVAFSTTTTRWSIDNSSSTDSSYTMSTVRRAHDSYEAIGIISTNPGIVLGKNVANGVPVAFQGRVPVKVTTENGEVKQGDYLTVSKTIPGYAMKLTGEGKSIGRALSDYTQGRDKVLVLVENSFQKLDMNGKTATTTGMLTTGNIDLNANGVAITNIKSLASANGTWSIDENGRIVAKVLCLEDLCIDKSTLTNILNLSGQQGTVLGTSSDQTMATSTQTAPTVSPEATQASSTLNTETPVLSSTSTSETAPQQTSTQNQGNEIVTDPTPLDSNVDTSQSLNTPTTETPPDSPAL
jgi:hypothetical protein